jgi:virginiamycin B lyase
MVWAMEFDEAGNLWFSDQRNNAIWRYLPPTSEFEMYKIPTPGSYPSSIVFDTEGKLWFSELFGKKIGLLDPVLTEHNTSKGITEYPIENVDFETLGPLSISNDNKNLWLTAVKFPEGGSILSFDIEKRLFSLHNSLRGSGVPIGIVEDDRGKLWINDHATNLFFSFDPITKKIVKYSTSLPTSRNNTTTLPYWNLIRDGHLWFNEHEGNAIAYFDIENATLIEFKIPTGSEIWGNTSNPLKFVVDNFGSAWFTEWTENKLGFLDNSKLKNLPIELNISKNRIVMDRKTLDEATVRLYVTPQQVDSNNRVVMTAAGSISPSGRLWNLTGEFNIKEFRIPNAEKFKEPVSYPIEFILKPTKDLLPGNYTLSIGARYADMTYSKIIELNVRE